MLCSGRFGAQVSLSPSFLPSAQNNSVSVNSMHKHGCDCCSIPTYLLHCCLTSLYLVGQDLPRSDLVVMFYSEYAEQSKSLEVSVLSEKVKIGFSVMCYTTPGLNCLHMNQV